MSNPNATSQRITAFALIGLLAGVLLLLGGWVVYSSLIPNVEEKNVELQVGSGKTLEVGVQSLLPLPWKVQLEATPETKDALRVTLEKPQVNSGSTTPVILSAPAETPPGEYQVILRTRLGRLSRTASLAVTVKPRPGSLDVHFGKKGLVLLDMGVDRIARVKALKDGKILVYAWEPAFPDDLMLEDRPFDERVVKAVRLNADGSKDLSFGKGGMLRFKAPGKVIDVRLDEDELHLLVAVETQGGLFRTYRNTKLTIHRYNFDGSLESKTPWENYLTDSKGRRFKVGSWKSPNPNYQACQITRLLSDGTVDSEFGNNGVYRSPVPADKDLYGWDCDEVMLDGDQIVYTEMRQKDMAEYQSTLRLVRLTAQGKLDPAFGGEGRSSPIKHKSIVDDMQMWPGVGGLFNTPQRYIIHSTYENALLAFTKQGERDLGFGNWGELRISSEDKTIQKLQQMSSGEMVLLGNSNQFQLPSRLLTDGTMVDYDPPTPQSEFSENKVFGMEYVNQDAQGRLLVVGLVGPKEEEDDAIAPEPIKESGLKTDVYVIRMYP